MREKPTTNNKPQLRTLALCAIPHFSAPCISCAFLHQRRSSGGARGVVAPRAGKSSSAQHA
eukprot:14351568-Alexandrium_andersonii.AAC.1